MTSFTASVRQSSADKPAVSVGDQYDDAEKNYRPKSLKFWTTMIGMYLSIFLVGLDRTIITTAIPKIADEFNSIEDIGWYGSAYMLATACVFPISGRIYQLYSTKWVFIISLVIFKAGSAPSSVVFIIGRAIAGLRSAGIFTEGMMIILPLVSLRKRPIYTSFFWYSYGINIRTRPSFRRRVYGQNNMEMVFHINLPIGGLKIIEILLFLHIPSPNLEKLTAVAQI